MVGVRNNREEITEVHVMPARGTQPYVEPDTKEVFYGMGDNPLAPDGLSVMVPARDVFHLRLFCPRHPLIGVSPIEAVVTSIAANGNITRNQATFFDRMSRPSGIISTDMTLTKQQMQDLRAAWDEQSKGMSSGGVPILGSGMKFHPMSITSQDAQLVEAFNMTVTDIARAFRVPLPIVNLYENATYNNVEQLYGQWLSGGLGFLLEHVERALEKFFSLPANQSVNFDTESLLRTDFEKKVNGYSRLVERGVLTINEARVRMDKLEGVDNGDTPIVQQQMVPLGWTEEDPEPPAEMTEEQAASIGDRLMQEIDYSAVVERVVPECVEKLRDEVSVDYTELALTVATHHADELRGPAGETPEIHVDDLVKELKSDASWVESLRGEKGRPGEQGQTGEKGEKGDQGEPGIDRPLIDPHFEDGPLEKGSVVHSAGGLWQATRKSTGGPENDPNSFRVVVNGIAEVEKSYNEREGRHDLSFRMSDGTMYTSSWEEGNRFHGFGSTLKPKAGDARIQESMLERHDGEKWKPAQSLKGEPGVRGRKGQKGDTGLPGVGIKSIDEVEGMVHISLTGGIEVGSEVDGAKIGDFTLAMGAADDEGRVSEFFLQSNDSPGYMKRFAGPYQQGGEYSRGDVVTAKSGLYLALNNTRSQLSTAADWVLIYGSSND